MQYRKFGNTGLTVWRLTLGTMTFGLQTEEEVSRSIMDRAADAGVNFIDTANVYPLGSGFDLVGRTEEIVGRWLKGKRDNFILATKAVHEMGPLSWQKSASKKHLLAEIDASLKRLGTDYVDLISFTTTTTTRRSTRCSARWIHIVKSGRARYIGVSNFLAYRLARAIGRADVLHTARFVSVQPRDNLLFRQIERTAVARDRGRSGRDSLQPALAGGLLTGKHSYGATPRPLHGSGRQGRRDV